MRYYSQKFDREKRKEEIIRTLPEIPSRIKMVTIGDVGAGKTTTMMTFATNYDPDSRNKTLLLCGEGDRLLSKQERKYWSDFVKTATMPTTRTLGNFGRMRTSIVNRNPLRLIYNKIEDRVGSDTMDIEIWDTVGQDVMHQHNKNHFANVDGALFLLDATLPVESLRIGQILNIYTLFIKFFVNNKYTVPEIVFLVNKQDVESAVKANMYKKVLASVDQEFGKYDFIPTIALDFDSVKKAMNVLLERILIVKNLRGFNTC
jgi:GTPase SAR1 family protein